MAKEIRKEVKGVLEMTTSEMDTSLVLSDRRRGTREVSLGRPPLNPTFSGRVATKSASFRRYTAVENEMMAVDRDLTCLEESNTALLATLEQRRHMPSRTLQGYDNGGMFAFGAEEEGRTSIIFYDAAGIKERRHREKFEKWRLEKEANGMKERISGLKREKLELVKKLADKRRHHERCQAEAREQEKRRRKEEMRSLRHQAGSSAREAGLLREELTAWAEERAFRRAREALWRWRARAATSAARRERNKCLAAEKVMAMTKKRGDARVGGYIHYDHHHTRRHFKANVAASSPEEFSRNCRREGCRYGSGNEEYVDIRDVEGFYPQVSNIGRNSHRVSVNCPVNQSSSYSCVENIGAPTGMTTNRGQASERVRRGSKEDGVAVESVGGGSTEEWVFDGHRSRSRGVTTGAAVKKHSRKIPGVHRQLVSAEGETDEAARKQEKRSQRTLAARMLLLGKHWTTWRVFTASSISAKMTRENNLKTLQVEAEKMNLRGQRLVLVCRAALIASDTRRKARAWRLWQQFQATLLQKRQATRMLSGVLWSYRRDMLGRAMSVWKSVAVRRARFLKLSALIDHRQRVFLLNRAWSRIVWAAGEGEAARARKLGAACGMYSLLASSARASRRRGWFQWKQMVAESVARQSAQRVALRRCQRLRLLRNKQTAWEALRRKVEKSSCIVSGVARLEATLFRLRMRRGWKSLEEATHRRAVLMRSVLVMLRSRSQLLRRALYHWRVVSVKARVQDARVEAGEPILKACLVGVNRRSMQPVWDSWRDLVIEKRRKEKHVADQKARWTTFSSLISRLTTRSNRERQARALIHWRLVAVRSAFTSAQAQMERQQAGATIALCSLRKRDALSQWRAAVAEERREDELGVWHSRASVQFSRELSRAVKKRRQRILRRSLQHWYREVNAQITYTVTIEQEAKSREAGWRQLLAVLHRNLLRRKARAWVRLVGTAVAASGRLEQERKAQSQRARHLTSAEFRASRRLLSKTWLAWKEISAEGKHAGEVRALRAERVALTLGSIIRRKNDDIRRFTVATWREKAIMAREREQGISNLAVCLMRSQVRSEREIVVRCFAQWRVVCAMKKKALAEKERSSAEVTVKGHVVLAVLRRKRLLCLSEGFRRLMHHRTLVVHETKKAQVICDVLRRVLARQSMKCVMSSFVRWRWYAAGVGQRSDHALLVSARTRAALEVLGAILSRRKMSSVSLAWRLWRSDVITAVYDEERASVDLRLSDAYRSAGIRLLVNSLGASRRRMLSRALSTWREEAKHVADCSIQARKMNMNLARTLVRIEKRKQMESVQRAWRGWNAYARTVARFGQILRRGRTSRIKDAMKRWQITCSHRQKAAAEERRAAAVAEMRGRAIMRLVEARRRHELTHAFHHLIEQGAWAIYWSKQRDARLRSYSRGFHKLGRAFARYRQRRKYAAFSRWCSFASECQRQHDKALLYAAGKRSGAKTLTSLVSRRSSSNVARAWSVWRSSAAAARAQEGERVSAYLRVVQANHVAGVRLLISALSSARRRTLANAWRVWGREKREAVEAELRSIKKYSHLARTLGRIHRRAELARIGQAWCVWRETVLIESQAEIQAMERTYNIAQTVTRVARRVDKRRLAKAWNNWSRLAARGWPRLSESFPSAPVGFLVAARCSQVPTLALAKADSASSSVTRAEEATEPNKTRAVALKVILRKAEVRALLCSWRTWKIVTETDSARQSKMILGARRLSGLLPTVQENHNARAVLRCWRTWTEWSMAERTRLEQAEAASRAHTKAEERNIKVAAGAEILARVTRLWEMRALHSCLIAWLDTVEISLHERNGVIGTEVPKDRGECDLEEYGLRARSPTTSPVAESVVRQKLQNEAYPVSPNNFMVVGSPSPSGRKVEVTNSSEDDVKDDFPITSEARAWLEGATRSSLDLSQSDSSLSVLADRSLSESQSSIATKNNTEDGSLGGGTRTQLLKAPPYVGGSVHSWSFIRRSSAQDTYREGEHDGEREQAALDSEMSPSLSYSPEEAPLIALSDKPVDAFEDGVEVSVVDNANRAEAFVSIVCAIIWRRALKQWGQVLREEVYRRSVTKANEKVITLRRHMKLRRVVVSFIRRQSYAWHTSDLACAMRKWREFVRKSVDDERSSVEISRMSWGSPMTPNGPRSIASGLGESWADINQVSEGNDEEEPETREDRTPSLPRSPFPPSAVEISYARRLWDPSET